MSHLQCLEGAIEAAHAGNAEPEVACAGIVARADEVSEEGRHRRHAELPVQSHQRKALAPKADRLLCTATYNGFIL